MMVLGVLVITEIVKRSIKFIIWRDNFSRDLNSEIFVGARVASKETNLDNCSLTLCWHQSCWQFRRFNIPATSYKIQTDQAKISTNPHIIVTILQIKTVLPFITITSYILPQNMNCDKYTYLNISVVT